MKRKDSILANFYYQSLPKAKEGGNYFQKYRVPQNNTPEYRVDPKLRFFDDGGEMEDPKKKKKSQKVSSKLAFEPMSYQELPEVTIYANRQQPIKTLPEVTVYSTPRQTQSPSAAILAQQAAQNMFDALQYKKALEKLNREPSTYTGVNVFKHKKLLPEVESRQSTAGFYGERPTYDVSPLETKTTLPAAYQSLPEYPLINTGKKRESSGSSALLAEMMARQAMMNADAIGQEELYINMLEQTDPEKAYLMRMMKRNPFQQKFFNGGFLMPAEEGGNINFPNQRGYTPERMAYGGDISIPDLTSNDWVTKYYTGGPTKCGPGEVSINGKCVKVNSDEYRKAYNQGIGRWLAYDQNTKKWAQSDANNPNAQWVSSPQTLPGITVKSKANPYITKARKQALGQVGSFDAFRQQKEAAYPSWYKGSSMYNPQKDLADQRAEYDKLVNTRLYQNVIDAIPQNKGEDRLAYINRLNSLAGKNFVNNAKGAGLTEPFDPSNIDLMKQWGWKGINHLGALGQAINNPIMAPYAIQQGIERGNRPVSGLSKEEAKNVGITQPFETMDDVAWDYGFKPLLTAGDNLFNPQGRSDRELAQRYMGPSETDKIFTSILNPLNYFGPVELLNAGKMVGKGAQGLKMTGRPSFIGTQLKNNLSFAKPKQSGIDFMKSWYNHPAIADRYNMFRNANPNLDDAGNILDYADQFTQAEKIGHARAALDQYVPKTYRDLWKDKKFLEALNMHLTSAGVSFGHPKGIYTQKGLLGRLGLGNIARESTTGHELGHLINRNGNLFNILEKETLLSPFGIDYAHYMDKIGGYKQPSIFPWADNRGYYLDPSEIYSRMKEARFNLGLRPEDVFTMNHFNKLKKDYNWFGMGKYIKDPERMIQVMNNFYSSGGQLPKARVGLELKLNEEPCPDGQVRVNGQCMPVAEAEALRKRGFQKGVDFQEDPKSPGDFITIGQLPTVTVQSRPRHTYSDRNVNIGDGIGFNYLADETGRPATNTWDFTIPAGKGQLAAQRQKWKTYLPGVFDQPLYKPLPFRTNLNGVSVPVGEQPQFKSASPEPQFLTPEQKERLKYLEAYYGKPKNQMSDFDLSLKAYDQHTDYMAKTGQFDDVRREIFNNTIGNPNSAYNQYGKIISNFVLPAGAAAGTALAAPVVLPALTSALSAPLTVGSTTVPWLTGGNMLGLYGGYHAANEFGDANSQTRQSYRTAYNNPTFSNIADATANTLVNTLGIATSPGMTGFMNATGNVLRATPGALRSGYNTLANTDFRAVGNTVGNTIKNLPTTIRNIPNEIDYLINKPKDISGIKNAFFLRKELGAPLGNNTGSFNYGVFRLKRFPENLVKFEDPMDVAKITHQTDYGDFDFVQAMRNIESPNIAKVIQQQNIPANQIQRYLPQLQSKIDHAIGQGYTKFGMPYEAPEKLRALFMPRLQGVPFEDLTLSQMKRIPNEAYTQMFDDIKSLRRHNLGFDFVGDNFIYDKASKSFKLFDVNPISSLQSPDWRGRVLGGGDILDFDHNDIVTLLPELRRTGMSLQSALYDKLFRQNIVPTIRDVTRGVSIGTQPTGLKMETLANFNNRTLDMFNQKLTQAIKRQSPFKHGGTTNSWLNKYPTGGPIQSAGVPAPVPTPQTGAPIQYGPTFSDQRGYTPPESAADKRRDFLLNLLKLGTFMGGVAGGLSKRPDKKQQNPSNQNNMFNLDVDGNGKPLSEEQKMQKGITWNYNPNIESQKIKDPFAPKDPFQEQYEQGLGSSMSMARRGGDVSIYGRRNYKSDTPSFFKGGGTNWLAKYDDGGGPGDGEKKTLLKDKQVGVISTPIKQLDLRPTFPSGYYNEIEVADPNCPDPTGVGCSYQATREAMKITGLPYNSYAPANAAYRDAVAERYGLQNIFTQEGEQKRYANSGNKGWKYPSAQDFSSWKAGDIVVLDAPGADIFSYNAPPGFTEKDNSGASHNGVIVGFTKEGRPVIRHGYGTGTKGKGKQITEVLGNDNRVTALGHGRYAVKSVWRPKEVTDDGTIESIKPIIDKGSDQAARKEATYYPASFSLKPTYEEKLMNELPVAAAFSDAPTRLNTKNNLVSLFNDTKLDKELQYQLGITSRDLQNLKPVIYGIAGQETNFHDVDNPLASMKDIPGNVTNTGNSKGLFQIKYGSLTEDERKMLDIQSPNDLLDDKKAYKAAILLMHNAKKRMDAEVEEGTHPGLKNADPFFRAAYYYNQPARAISTAQQWAKGSNPVVPYDPTTWLNPLVTRERPHIFGSVNPDYVSKIELRMDKGSYPHKLMQKAKDLQMDYDYNQVENLEEVVVRGAKKGSKIKLNN